MTMILPFKSLHIKCFLINLISELMLQPNCNFNHNSINIVPLKKKNLAVGLHRGNITKLKDDTELFNKIVSI